MGSSNHSAGSVASTYLEDQIRSETPIGRVARVLEMACAHTARARSALADGDLAAKGMAVSRASRCIALLQNSLDMERGEDVAVNLDRIYSYLLRQMTSAHARNNVDGFEEILQHLTELASAWREAAGQQLAQPEPAPSDARSSATP